MKRRITFMFFSCLLSFLNVSLYAQVWEPVGDPAGVSAGQAGRLALKVDQQDNIVVGYYDASVAKGSVQRFDGNSWTYLGDGPGMTAATATYNSLSVDAQGVVYFTNQAGWPAAGLNVHKFINNTWESLPDAASATINFQASAVSANGTLFVATGENTGLVKRFVNGAWEQVGNAGFFGGGPSYLSMTIANDDRIYVSWNNNGFVHVYTNIVNASETDLWEAVGNVPNIAPATTSENYNSAVAVDLDNNLFLAYVSDNDGGRKLNVKKFNGETWSQLGPQNFTENRVQHISIAIGSNDIIYVAVSNWENENHLRNYVMAYDESTNTWHQAGTGWASVDKATNNSLAVDSNGNLYLGFVDSGLGKLSVKKLNLEIVAAESLIISTEAGLEPEITIDNGTIQLLAVVTPEQASQQVVWTLISGENHATIDQTGLLTATTSNAVVTVKAHAAENISIFNTIDVSITNQISPVQPQETYITTENNVNPDILSLDTDLQLYALTIPVEADQYVTWSVQVGADVASVDENGLVTPLAEGFAVLRATNSTYPELFDEIRVNVWEYGCTQFNDLSMVGIGYGINNGHLGADDFVVESETRFRVGTVRMKLMAQSLTEFTSFDLRFLKNDIDRPGEVLTSVNIVPTSQVYVTQVGMFHNYDVQLDLTEPVILDQGTYWISPIANTVDGNVVYWGATVNTGGIDGFSLFVDYNDGHGWRGLGGFNGVFEITGSCTPMPVVVKPTNGSEAKIYLNESLQLEAIVNVSGLSQNVNWSVETGTDFATVSSTGVVTGIGVGVATIKAVSVDDQTVFGILDVAVHDPNECFQQVVSNNMENGYTFGGIQLAIDIEVQSGQTFTISSIDINTGDLATTFSFVFFKDVDGLPGDQIVATATGNIVQNRVIGHHNVFLIYFHQYSIELTTPVVLSPGLYWMQCTSNALAWESTSSDINGFPGAFKSEATGNVWVYSSNGSDFVYKVNGLCETVTDFPSPNAVAYNYSNNTVNLIWEAPEAQAGFNLVGYKIYKGGQQIGTTDASTLNFGDPNSVNGTYTYGVSAVYGEPLPGESMPATVSVIIDLYPAIAVNPNSYVVSFNTPNVQATENMTIENNGTSLLHWTATIEYLNKNKTAAIDLTKVGAIANTNNFNENDPMLSTRIHLNEIPELALQSDVNGGQPLTTERDNAVLNYDGDNADAIGLTSGGSFYAAARFPASMTAPYAGFELESVDVFINHVPSASKLMIYAAGSATAPGALLHEQTFTGAASSWVTINLTSPVAINGTDIWVGYFVTHAGGQYPAGCDAGPGNSNGDWISTNGSTWGHLVDAGLSANWNIRANLSGSTQWLSLQSLSGDVAAGGNHQLEVYFDATGLENAVYEAIIRISSNDPETPQLTIPVTMALTVGVDENEFSGIEVYPNPAKGLLNITIPTGINEIKMYNHIGQEVKSENVAGQISINWNLESVPGGTYLLKFVNDKGMILNKRIIIM